MLERFRPPGYGVDLVSRLMLGFPFVGLIDWLIDWIELTGSVMVLVLAYWVILRGCCVFCKRIDWLVDWLIDWLIGLYLTTMKWRISYDEIIISLWLFSSYWFFSFLSFGAISSHPSHLIYLHPDWDVSMYGIKYMGYSILFYYHVLSMTVGVCSKEVDKDDASRYRLDSSADLHT